MVILTGAHDGPKTHVGPLSGARGLFPRRSDQLNDSLYRGHHSNDETLPRRTETVSNNFQPSSNPYGSPNRWQSAGNGVPDGLPPSRPGATPQNPPAQDFRWSQQAPQAPQNPQPQQAFGQPVAYPHHAQPPQFAHVPGTPAAYDMSAPRKSKTVAVLLSLPFIVGALGLHDFYLGHTGRGVLHLVLLVLAFIPILGWWVIAPLHGLWIIVELILIVAGAGDYGRDQQGRPLV